MTEIKHSKIKAKSTEQETPINDSGVQQQHAMTYTLMVVEETVQKAKCGMLKPRVVKKLKVTVT